MLFPYLEEVFLKALSLPLGCFLPCLETLPLPAWMMFLHVPPPTWSLFPSLSEFCSLFGGIFLPIQRPFSYWKEFFSLLGEKLFFFLLGACFPTCRLSPLPWGCFLSQPGACFPPQLEFVLLPAWRQFSSLSGGCFPPCQQFLSIPGRSFPPSSREHRCHHSLITQMQPDFPS